MEELTARQQEILHMIREFMADLLGAERINAWPATDRPPEAVPSPVPSSGSATLHPPVIP